MNRLISRCVVLALVILISFLFVQEKIYAGGAGKVAVNAISIAITKTVAPSTPPTPTISPASTGQTKTQSDFKSSPIAILASILGIIVLVGLLYRFLRGYLKKLFRQAWREIVIIIAFIAGVWLLCILLLEWNFIHGGLFDSLIGGIVGAGVIGFFVALLIYAVQKHSDILQQKQKAETFYNARLKPSIRVLFSREISPWNVDGGKMFYFDNSRINFIYDLYDKYAEALFDYQTLFEDNEIVKSMLSIYQQAREGYVFGEKIDQYLFEHIRLFLADKGVGEEEDIYMLRYLKAILFTGKDQTWAAAKSGRNILRPYHGELYRILQHESAIITWQAEIKTKRKEMEKEVSNLYRLRVIYC